MKKILFFAATAMLFAACANDELVSQSEKKAVADQAVGFDVYVPGATASRAGLEGTMTTSHLQRSEYEGGGFGVYAYQVQDNAADAGTASSYLDLNADGNEADGLRKVPASANFMVNEKILWNATSMGWYYSPIKYWPNETDNDSQNTNATMIGDETNNHTDRLTFFAYAPYVSAGVTGEPGITHVTANTAKLNTKADGSGDALTLITRDVEPSIAYQAALDNPNQSVDLLWGVAPAGGLTYTAVNGKTVTAKEGDPLMDMTKPDVNTNMKFLFQHALARIGVTAVAAVDQVGPGGKLDPNTKITINKITLTGWFGQTGVLNLDNEKTSVANWYALNGVDLTDNTSVTKVDGAGGLFDGKTKTTLTLVADNTKGLTSAAGHQNGTIARHLQFVNTDATVPDPEAASEAPVAQDERVGVTTVRQSVIMPAIIDNASGPGHNRSWYSTRTAVASTNELPYSESTPYYTTKDCKTTELATASITVPSAPNYLCTISSTGVYTTETSTVSLTYPAVNKYYVVTFKEVVDDDYASYDATIHVKVGATGVSSMQAYDRTGSGPYTFTPDVVGKAPEVGEYVITTAAEKATALYPSNAAGITYYRRDANYFMVVPTNNVTNICTAITSEEELKKLRTVRVMVEYYITSEDSKLAGGLTQTKNVIEKDVVFPSIANGKSYNLNLVLGLTSVKFEAEVDEWKVVNVQGDLPQNTAGE